MDKRELLQTVSEETGMDPAQVELVYNSMVETISTVLSRGEEVVLTPDFGTFIPKFWDNPGRNENSPRTLKKSKYNVRFRPGNQMQKKLTVGSVEEDGSCCD